MLFGRNRLVGDNGGRQNSLFGYPQRTPQSYPQGYQQSYQHLNNPPYFKPPRGGEGNGAVNPQLQAQFQSLQSSGQFKNQQTANAAQGFPQGYPQSYPQSYPQTVSPIQQNEHLKPSGEMMGYPHYKFESESIQPAFEKIGANAHFSDKLRQFCQNEKNAETFYKYIAYSAPSEHRQKLVQIADCAGATCGRFVPHCGGYVPNVINVRDEFDFHGGLRAALVEENKMLYEYYEYFYAAQEDFVKELVRDAIIDKLCRIGIINNIVR